MFAGPAGGSEGGGVGEAGREVSPALLPASKTEFIVLVYRFIRHKGHRGRLGLQTHMGGLEASTTLSGRRSSRQ